MTDDLRSMAARDAVSAPQPDPITRGQPVTPALVAWLTDRGEDVDQLVALVEARDAFGRRKYGQPLYSDDGRDVSADFGQELADALQYGMAARMRGVSLAVWAPVLRALADLVSDDAQDLDRRVIAGVQTQRGLPFP